MSEVRLEVNGRRYSGWKSVRVTRSMDTLCGSFELSAIDRWTERGQVMGIRPQDECRVLIDDDVVISGYVDARPIRIDGSTREQSARGRDKALDIHDSAAQPFGVTRRATLLNFAKKLCEPHGVNVSLGTDVTLPAPPPKYTVNPGDTVFQVLSREAQAAGVLLLSDGRGGILFDRSGSARAAPLRLGMNIKTIDGEDDDSQRFHRYLVLAQRGGSKDVNGGSVHISGEATDSEVHRQNRVHVSRPMAAKTSELAQQAADWIARKRAGMARSRTVGVVGWRQQVDDPSSALWAPNLVTSVEANEADFNGDKLIASVTYSLDIGGGEVATMLLVDPSTYQPEPA